MALKGTTKIELTNVKTGEVEVVEKNNLVTNAVSDFLTMNPDGYLYTSSIADQLPVCPNLIGGILLYGNQLEENPEKYYAKEDNPLIGYSSNSVNEGTDTKRGSLNQTESGMLEDGSGYRFVFDFETSQGNGIISALGLTSKWGGESGYGSELLSENVLLRLSTATTKMEGTTDYASRPNAKYGHIVSIDPANDIAYFAYVSAANTIRVGKITVDFNKIGLALNVGPQALNVFETTDIQTTVFASKAPSSARYYSVNDGEDGYIWMFEHQNGAAGNSSGNATINYVKISKSDFSITEGSFSVTEQLYIFGMHNGWANNNYSEEAANYSVIHNGFLYCLRYNRTAVVKIELKNPTNLIVMENPKGTITVVRPMNNGSAYGATEFNIIGDIVYFPGGYICKNEIQTVYTLYVDQPAYDVDTNQVSPKGLKGGCGSNLQYGPYLIMFDRRTKGVRRHVYLMTPYLATINNLPTPVQKTADKTMKITYILREES